MNGTHAEVCQEDQPQPPPLGRAVRSDAKREPPGHRGAPGTIGGDGTAGLSSRGLTVGVANSRSGWLGFEGVDTLPPCPSR